jgi:hypothetical protein
VQELAPRAALGSLERTVELFDGCLSCGPVAQRCRDIGARRMLEPGNTLRTQPFEMLGERATQEAHNRVVDAARDLCAHGRLVEQRREVVHALPLEIVEQPGDRLFRDHQARNDPLVQQQLAYEPLEELVERELDAVAGVGVGQDRGEPVEGNREVSGHLLFHDGDQVLGQTLEQRRPILTQALCVPIDPSLDRRLELGALGRVDHPSLDPITDRVLPSRSQELADRAVGEFVAGLPQDVFDLVFESIGRDVRDDGIGDVVGDCVDRPLDLGQDPWRQLLPQRSALGFEEGLHEVPDRTFERLSHTRRAQLARQILRGNESLPNRASDGLGQPRLVLGDRSLEPEAPEPARFVRMEQHRNGNGVGHTAGDGTEYHGDARPEE